jgi:hypothetical protein
VMLLAGDIDVLSSRSAQRRCMKIAHRLTSIACRMLALVVLFHDKASYTFLYSQRDVPRDNKTRNIASPRSIDVPD